MKKLLLTLYIFYVAFAYSFTLFALPDQEWNKGTLVLNNQQVLKGKIIYLPDHDLVQIKLNNQVKTFSAVNVSYFDFFDESCEIKRTFAALDYESKRQNRKAKKFFEVLLHGDIILLRKIKHYYFPSHEILYNAIDLIPSMGSNHFILNEGYLIMINNFGKDVLPVLKDHKDEIASYIESKKLDLTDIVSQILVIDYYNYLKDPSRKVFEENVLVRE